MVAVGLLLTAVVVHTVGELWHSAGGFEVSYALAPPHATGQYLGVFGLGAGLSEAVGPGLLIALCVGWGRPGWFAVGALFALTGLLTPLAVRRAEAGRAGAASRVSQSKRATTPMIQTVTKAATPTTQPMPARTPPTVQGSAGASSASSSSSS